MKVSIITATFNKAGTIEGCIESVLNQSYKDIEFIIVDGGSRDRTMAIIEKHNNKISHWVSEPDKGIYDAFNKGLELASGDVVGFLNADDFYTNDNVIETIVSHMTKYNVDSCYGDLLYVNGKNIERIIRYWKSCPYKAGLFRNGWMPPHPTFFVKKDVYKKYGYFNTDLSLSADYELMLRFLAKYNISTLYIPEIFVKMRIGGVSNGNLRNMLIKTVEDYKSWKLNDLHRRIYTIPFKKLSKIPQFFKREDVANKRD